MASKSPIGLGLVVEDGHSELVGVEVKAHTITNLGMEPKVKLTRSSNYVRYTLYTTIGNVRT